MIFPEEGGGVYVSPFGETPPPPLERMSFTTARQRADHFTARRARDRDAGAQVSRWTESEACGASRRARITLTPKARADRRALAVRREPQGSVPAEPRHITIRGGAGQSPTTRTEFPSSDSGLVSLPRSWRGLHNHRSAGCHRIGREWPVSMSASNGFRNLLKL